jgi:glycosyltransferase involved in cell wall biosynthesis
MTKSGPLGYRVLVICNDGDYFLRHRLSVVSHLASVGADVTVVAGGNPIPPDYIDGWKYLHVPIERFRFHPLGDAALMIRTARIIWRFRPDAVHLITLKPTIFSGMVSIASHLFHGHPERILITLPGLGRMMSPKAPGERRYRLANALTLFAFRRLASSPRVHFTFETKHDYDFWAARGIASRQNSSVIDGVGVNPDLFYPQPIPQQSAPARSKIKVLFASRLLKSKGLNAFLMMAKQLSDRPDVEFLVAGMSDDGDPDAVSPRHLSQSSEIRFLGNVENMPDLLRQCDIVCLPTRYGEGIPRILIEAAATGLASVASSHPGCREVVEDGVTGEILPIASDSEMCREMCAAVERYLNTPARLAAHKEAAYRHFQSREFNQYAVVVRFTELLGANPSLERDRRAEASKASQNV